MNNDSIKKYSEILKILHIVPDWYSNKLFEYDLAINFGWQINCIINNSKNRIVYSFYDGKKTSEKRRKLDNFQAIHVRTFGYELYNNNEKILTFDNYSKQSYLNDLNPLTIAMIVQQTIKEKPHVEDLFLTYLLSLSDSMQEWAEHFKKMTNELYNIKESVDDIYDESL